MGVFGLKAKVKEKDPPFISHCHLIKDLKSKMILSVHDELVFEIHKAELGIVIDLVTDIMENTIKLSVPLKMDFKIGTYWGGNSIL